MRYHIKALEPSTWKDFETLALRHNGVWGGCWCTWFHQSDAVKTGNAEFNRQLKKDLVWQGKAHAALVYEGNDPIAWCQYGTPQELPHIYHKAIVEVTGYRWPDWRITCFFVDKRHRRQGAAKAALLGALELIRAAGGGVVESYPQDTEGKPISSSFLYNGTRSLFEECGFAFAGPKGKNHTIMQITVR